MTDAAPPPPPPGSDTPSRLPRDTTPTWEVELLISGVTVFAMLQLPGWLDNQMFALEPRFNELWGDPLLVLYVYLKCAALTLAVTFSMHLLLRAQWIAMVGMHSIYPGGIRWDKLRMGPILREIEVRRHGGPDVAIERVDNRSTVVFSIGVMMASMFLLVSVLAMALFPITLAIATLTGAKTQAVNVLGASLAIALLPLFLANLVDRHFGSRLRLGGVAQRALSAVLGFYARIGLTQRASNPIFSLLASHGGERKAVALTTVVTLVIAVAVAFSYASLKDPMRMGNYGLFPTFSDNSRTLESAHYADQRNPTRDPAVPFITSIVAKGPYLQLVVPYQPQRDAIALRDSCPSAAATNGDARATAALDCLQRLHAVTLDGVPMAALQYDLGDDASTNRPALVAMIDVRALAHGRHELQVARGGGDESGDEEQGAHWRIPFWR